MQIRTPSATSIQTDELSDVPAAERSRSRRVLLTGALGALGGWLAGAVGQPRRARAAAGDPLILGQSNFAGGSPTRLFATSAGGAFWMTQNGSGSGVRGESTSGTGGVFQTHHPDRHGILVQQDAAGPGGGTALRAESTRTGISVTAGLAGVDATGAEGVRGTSELGAGVHGISTASTGTWGQSTSGTGAFGFSDSGIGVLGGSNSNYGGWFEGPLATTRHLDIQEHPDPGAPPSSGIQFHARLFVRDNGSGKSQLCVRFQTGAIQVIATEP